MDHEALAACPAAGGRDGDVDWARLRLQDRPQVGRVEVTEDCSRSTGEDGGHPEALAGQVRVADGVDAAVQAMEATRANVA